MHGESKGAPVYAHERGWRGRRREAPPLLAICLLPAAVFAADGAPKSGADDPETDPGFDPTAVPETVTDRVKEWAAEADETASLIRKAVAEGAAAGRKERITIKFGGRSQNGRVVSADEAQIVVSLPGVEVPLQWEMVAPRTMLGIGRKYLPTGEAEMHLKLGRYCLVHGFAEEAEKEFLEAVRVDPAAVNDVRAALDFVRNEKIARRRIAAKAPKEERKRRREEEPRGRMPARREMESGWTSIGPGGGGAMFTPFISPHDSAVAILYCDMGGIYRTIDGGEKWQMLQRMGIMQWATYDPFDPDTVYLATQSFYTPSVGGIYKSADCGVTWERRSNRRAVFLLCDPDAAGVIYGLQPDKSGCAEFLKSENGGESWAQRGGFPQDRPVRSAGLPPPPYRLVIDRKSTVGRRTIIACTGYRLYASKDSGDSWNRIWVEMTGKISDMEGYNVSDRRKRWGELPLYVSIHGKGIYRSVDYGATFECIRQGDIIEIAVCESDPDVVYATDGEHVYRTVDRGKSWRTVLNERGRNSGNAGQWSWGGRCLGIEVAPGNSSIVYATDQFRALKSTDGGTRWESAYSKKAEAGFWATRGLDVTAAYYMRFNPGNPDEIFIGYQDINLWKSVDGGTSFRATAKGVPTPWSYHSYDLKYDPADTRILYEGVGYPHCLPENRVIRMLSTDRSRLAGGLCVSRNGGGNWQPIGRGQLPDSPATGVVIDPDSPPSQRTLWVTSWGHGVYKSTDGGDSWARKSNGIDTGNLNFWRLYLATRVLRSPGRRRVVERTLYCIVTKDVKRGTDIPGAVYRSGDGAETWEKIHEDGRFSWPLDLDWDPRNPDVVYVAGFAFGWWGAHHGGVYKTEDGGNTWKKVLNVRRIYGVTVDRKAPNRVYAAGCATDGYTVYRSDDCGRTWQGLEGLNIDDATDVYVDPRDSNLIWVTTFGESVWRGPAQGVSRKRR